MGALGAAAAIAVAAWLSLAPTCPPDLGRGDEPASAEAGRTETTASLAASATAGRREQGAHAIRGRVVDLAGAAVSDVDVFARCGGDPASDSADERARRTPESRFAASCARALSLSPEAPVRDASARSDAAGRFEMRVDRAGRYRITAAPTGTRVALGAWVPVGLGPGPTPASVLVLDGTRLRARVVDARGRGLRALVEGDWEVEGSALGWSLDPMATDAQTGEASAVVPHGKGTLTVRVPGVARLEGIEATTPREGVLLVRVGGGGGVVEGVVRDAGGAPVAGADMTVEIRALQAGRAPDAPASALVRARSAVDGAFRIEDAPPGMVARVEALREGFVLHSSSPPLAPWSGAEVAAGKAVRIDVVLRCGGTVTGVVRIGEGGIAVAGARVALAPARGGAATARVVASDADGRYRFTGVEAGRWLLLVRHPGLYQEAIERPQGSPSLTVVLSDAGETLVRDLELRAGIAVRGRVLAEDDRPVGGADVCVEDLLPSRFLRGWEVEDPGFDPRVARSAEDGSFEVAGLAPRPDWTIHARRLGLVGVSRELALEGGTSHDGFVLRLERGARIEGRVVTADGCPMSGVYVQFDQKGSRSPSTVSGGTGADGAFVLDCVPAGTRRLEAWRPDECVGALADLDPPVVAGETRTAVELRFRGSADVSGVVVDARGEPIVGRCIRGCWLGEYGSTSTSTRSDEEGRFEFREVPTGTRVHLSEEESPDPLGSAVAPVHGLRFLLDPLPRTVVDGRVVAADGSPVPLFEVRSGWDCAEAVGGRFRVLVEGAPPCEVRVGRPRDDRGRPLNLLGTTVTVADPAAGPVRVVLERGCEIEGRVVDPDGNGVAGVSVAVGGKRVLSGSDGGFRCVGLADESTWVGASAPKGFVDPVPSSVRPGTSGVVLSLGRTTAIAGRVVGPDGSPFAVAMVRCTWERDGADGISGPDGEFRVTGIPFGVRATVHAWAVDRGDDAPRVCDAHVEGVRSGADDLVLRLEAGSEMSGTLVSPSGVVPAGLVAYLRPQRRDLRETEMDVDESGDFGCGRVPPGTYEVRVEAPFDRGFVLPHRIQLPQADLRIDVPDASAVDGRVIGEGLLPGLSIRVWPAGDPQACRVLTHTEHDGTFSVALPKGHSYVLAVSRARDDAWALAGPLLPGSGSVVLRLRPGASITGRLEHGDGTSSSGSVTASNERFCCEADRARDGAFVLSGLPPGTYVLRGSEGDAESEAVVGGVPAGARGVVLRMR